MDRVSTSARRLLVLASASLAVLSACGSDDDADSPTTSPQITRATESSVGGPPTENSGSLDETEPTASGADSTNAGEPGGPADFAGQIVFGANFELTGAMSPVGLAAIDGVELAIADINAEGGVLLDDERYEIVLESRDNQNDPSLAATNATELIRDVGAKFIFGPSGTAPAQAQIPLTAASEVMTFTNDPSIDAILTAAEPDPNYEFVFKYSELAGRFLSNSFANIGEAYPEGETIALLLSDDASGVAMSQSLPALIEGSSSMELVGTVTFPTGTQDLSPFLTEIRALDADVIYQCCDLAANVSIGQQIVELDAADAFWGVAFSDTTYEQIVDALGAPPENAFISATSSPAIGKAIGDPRREQFAAHIDEVLGREPQSAAYITGQLYQVARNLAEAIEKAGTASDVAAIRDELIGLRRDDVSGEAFVTPQHYMAMPQEIVIYRSGEVEKRLLLPALPVDEG